MDTKVWACLLVLVAGLVLGCSAKTVDEQSDGTLDTDAADSMSDAMATDATADANETDSTAADLVDTLAEDGSSDAPPDSTPDDMCPECGSGCPAGSLCDCGVCICQGALCDQRCVDVTQDPKHCGGCAVDCTAGQNVVSAQCQASTCTMQCRPDYADCNSVIADGCEAYLGSLATCGACTFHCVGAELCVNQSCFDPGGFVVIAAATFTMGSPTTEVGRFGNENAHSVQITRSFVMRTTEVTLDDWMQLMGNNPSDWGYVGNRPVDSVSWYDALAYCNALSQYSGLETCYDLSTCTGVPGTPGYTCPDTLSFSLDCEGYRLPTEAEWELAARGGTQSATYLGEIESTSCFGGGAALETIAWYCGTSGNAPNEVATKVPNNFGLYDMLGNVWEWTWDWSGPYPMGSEVDPIRASGTLRTTRGGATISTAEYCRAATRQTQAPSELLNLVGFRIVRTILP